MGTHTQGRFVWHDLMTTDAKGAVSFYGELFGWKTREMDMGPNGIYYIIVNNGVDQGGIAQQPPGGHAAWMPVTTVLDIDAASKKITQHGGQVVMAAHDIPNVGKYAIAKDPTGATFSPFWAQDEKAQTETPPAGAFCWDELATTDPQKAIAFYQEILGWRIDEGMDMGDMGKYYLCHSGEKQVAGIMKTKAGMPTMWLSYVAVADVDASTQRATKMNAKTYAPPMDIPGIGRFSVIGDPQGAALALFKGTPKK